MTITRGMSRARFETPAIGLAADPLSELSMRYETSRRAVSALH
jgi:hypothetical protein